MPWRTTDVSEQRAQFVIRADSGKEVMAELCREFSVSRNTGYRWLKRYRETGSISGLMEFSRRPHHSPRKTSAALEQQVLELRERYGWGARKLATVLRQRNVMVPVVTTHRILERHGHIAKEDSHRPALHRFERAEPNQLWQMDAKAEYRFPGGKCFPLTLLDDCSRYLVGLHALPRFRSETVHDALVHTFRECGVPEAMLMDHGIQWWNSQNARGVTWLTIALIKQGIKIYYSGICHPQTQGKVERLHRTLKESIVFRGGPPATWTRWPPVLADFRDEYNHIRPHQALNMATPASRYRSSPRCYQECPPEWEYPNGAELRRVPANGMLRDRDCEWFVSQALVGEQVCLEHLSDRILVIYRDMYWQEVDRATGQTWPLVLPVAEGRQES